MLLVLGYLLRRGLHSTCVVGGAVATIDIHSATPKEAAELDNRRASVIVSNDSVAVAVPPEEHKEKITNTPVPPPELNV